MDGPGVYARNAELMWRAFGAVVTEETGDYVRFEMPLLSRIIVRRPTLVMPANPDPSRRMTIEDSWGNLPGNLTMPVMNRPAGPVPPAETKGVGRIGDADELAEAERVIVDGFPQRAYQPWARGKALPERLLGVAGWTGWLARRHGQPAAAGFTYDDGTAVGVYWLATAPAHRGQGLARAIMTEMLAAHENRIATLVATEAGEPLYRSLGFRTVSTATWVTHVPER